MRNIEVEYKLNCDLQITIFNQISVITVCNWFVDTRGHSSMDNSEFNYKILSLLCTQIHRIKQRRLRECGKDHFQGSTDDASDELVTPKYHQNNQDRHIYLFIVDILRQSVVLRSGPRPARGGCDRFELKLLTHAYQRPDGASVW